MWPFSHRTPRHTGPSPEALDSILEGERDLREAKHIRSEAEEVGRSLRNSHAMNHVGESLIAMITGKGATP